MVEFEAVNENLMARLSEVMPLVEEMLVDFPHFTVPSEVTVAYQGSRDVCSRINDDREKILQIISVTQEYEQTLSEFTKMMDIADELMVLPVTAPSLAHLQVCIHKFITHS